MIKVGFIINFKKNSWLGGYNYFINLFKCISLIKKNKIIPVIITDNSKIILNDKILRNFEVIETSLVNKQFTLLRIIQKISLLIFNKNILLHNFLKKNGIKSLSHSEVLGKNSSIPSYPWFPDFQEIHLPENFTKKDKFFRKLNIKLASTHSTKIIVSTNSVQKDLKKISYEAFMKSCVIKHHALLPEKINFQNFLFLKKKYNIKKSFFLVPNHYWQHKNHLCILKAIKELKSKKIDFEIISTGLFHDHRNPSHLISLKTYIKENKLEKYYKIIGIIPFVDMLSLMYHSLAVINPSKSEGLSNSVEQAKTLHKNVILSNIPVHKEQISKNFYYFEVNDHNKLASLMYKHLKYKKLKKKQKIKEIKKNNIIKNLNFAKKYQKLIVDNITL